MSSQIFKVSQILDPAHVNEFFIGFNIFKGSLVGPTKPEVIFDFLDCRFIRPVGVVCIASARDELVASHYQVKGRISSESKIAPALRFFGILPKVQALDDALDLTLRRDALALRRCNTFEDLGTAVNEIVLHIEKKIRPTQTTKAAIAYMINELLDNSARHGYKCYNFEDLPNPVYIAGYSYKNYVEVAILDSGQGIYQSLKQRRENESVHADDAIAYAMRNRTSGAPDGSPGFGLYSSSQFVRLNGGEICIWSSRRRLHQTPSGEVSGRSHNRGTIVSIKLNALVETPFEKIVTADTSEDLLTRWGLESK